MTMPSGEIDGLLRRVAAEKAIQGAYRGQVEQARAAVAIKLINGKHYDAARKMLGVELAGDSELRVLRVLCSDAETFLGLRGMIREFARLARDENLSRVVLEWGEKKAQASPKMAGQYQRKTNMTTTPLIALPGIQIGKMRLSRPLLEVLIGFAENPGDRCGVVELETQRQLIVTEASAQMILGREYDRLLTEGKEAEIRERVAAATNLRREDYFHLPDLEEFNRETRQRLEPNNPHSSIRLRWRGIGRDKLWREFHHEYRLVSDDIGRVYHVAKNLESREIAAPSLV